MRKKCAKRCQFDFFFGHNSPRPALNFLVVERCSSGKRSGRKKLIERPARGGEANILVHLVTRRSEHPLLSPLVPLCRWEAGGLKKNRERISCWRQTTRLSVSKMSVFWVPLFKNAYCALSTAQLISIIGGHAMDKMSWIFPRITREVGISGLRPGGSEFDKN